MNTMVSTDDVQAYDAKFKNQLEKLKHAEIAEADRDAIHAFVRHEDTQASVNTGTIVSNLNRLRLSAERGARPLTELQAGDVDELLFTLKHDHGLSEGTLRNYRKALRKFYRFRGKSWWEEIEVGASPDRSVDPNDLLTEDEIHDLIAAASMPRDKALVAMLADTGLRIGAIASLRMRDVDLSGRAGTVTINEDANVKGASGTVPLTWSRGYLANWLDIHPRADDPDAALIHKLHHLSEGEDGAMTYQYLSSRVKSLADDADVDRERVNTHNFRKSAITRWIREGLSEQAIKHRATWHVDTDQFQNYSGVRDEEMNAEILNHYDLADEDVEHMRPELESCPQCRTPLPERVRFCPGCGGPLTAGAAETVDGSSDRFFESAAETADEDRIRSLRAVDAALDEYPEAREAVLDVIED